jgi:hypothetical protein
MVTVVLQTSCKLRVACGSTLHTVTSVVSVPDIRGKALASETVQLCAPISQWLRSRALRARIAHLQARIGGWSPRRAGPRVVHTSAFKIELLAGIAHLYCTSKEHDLSYLSLYTHHTFLCCSVYDTSAAYVIYLSPRRGSAPEPTLMKPTSCHV